MSSLLGTMSVMLQFGTVGTTKALKEIRLIDRAAQATTSSITMSAKDINTAMMSIGRTLTQFVTLPLGILQVVSAKTFSTFEYNLSKVTGLVGIASAQTQQWGKQIQVVSRTVGKSATELSEALYFVTTGGIRGKETMDVLTTSAKLSAVGLGEVKTVSDILVSAINAYGAANLSTAKAADVLIRSVREGKAEADKLVTSMGVVFPIASQLGVSFGEVGAGMAAMTRTGTTAATSATQLRRMLFGILKPAQGAEEAMRTMGTSSAELRQSLQDDGLLETLLKLKDMMEIFGENIMAKAFPNIRALAGILDILGPNLEENKKLFDSIANSGGDLAAAFGNVGDTFKFKVQQTMAQANSLLVKYGEILAKILIPFFERLADKLSDVGRWFENLTESQKRFVANIMMIVTATGPLLAILAAFISLVRGIGAIFGFTKTEIAKNTAALAAQTAAMEAQTAAQIQNSTAAIKASTVKKELIVSTRTLAKLEQEAALASVAASRARKIADAEVARAEAFRVASKNRLRAAELQLIAAEKQYNAAIKSGMGIRAAEAKMFAAEYNYKTKLLFYNVALANATNAATAQTARKIKVDLLSGAAVRAQTAAEQMRAAILQKQLAVAEAARLAQVKLTVSTSATNWVLGRQITALQLQSVTMYQAAAGTKALTVAMSGLDKVINGVLALGGKAGVLAVIASLVVWQYALIKQARELTPLQKEQKKIRDSIADSVTAETSALSKYLSIARNEALSLQMRNEAMNEINKINPQYLGGLKLATINTEDATKAVRAYTSSLEEQTRIKSLYDGLQELEKNYTQSVMDGTNKRVTGYQKYWAVQAYIFHSMGLYQAHFARTGLSWGAQMEYFEEKNAKARKERFEEQKRWYQKELADREKLILSLANESNFVEDNAQAMIRAEVGYQKAVQQTEQAKLKAITNIIREGKTQEQYEQEVRRTILETEKAIKSSGAVHKNKAKETIESLDAMIAKYKEQEEYFNNIVNKDPLLKQYSDNALAAQTAKEKKLYRDLHNERLEQLKVIKERDLAYFQERIRVMMDLRKEMEGIYGEKVLSIKIDPDLQKIKNDLNDALSILDRKKEIFGFDTLEFNENKLSILKSAMEAYAEMNDAERAPLGDDYIKSLQSEYNLTQDIIKSLTKTKDVKKDIRNLNDVYNDFVKSLKVDSIKNTLFDTSYLDTLSNKTNIYKSALDDIVDTYINGLVEKQKDPETGKLKMSMDKILAGVDYGKLFTSGSKALEIKIKYDTALLAQQAIEELNNSMERMMATHEGYMEVQFENAQRTEDVTSSFSMLGAMMTAYEAQLEGVKAGTGQLTMSFDDLRKMFEEVSKNSHLLPTDLLAQFKGFENILTNLEVGTIFVEMNAQIAEAERKAALFGDTFQELDIQADILNRTLSRLRGINTEAFSPEELIQFKALIMGIVGALNEVTKAQEKQIERWKYIADILGSVGDIFKSLSDRRLQQIEKEYNEEIKMAGHNATMKAKIEENYQKKRLKLEQRAARMQKLFALFQIAIDTAMNMVKAATKPWLIPWIIASGAMAAAAVVAQPIPGMKEGGIVPQGYPNDSYPARLTSGEMVIPPHKLPEFNREPISVHVTVEGTVKGKDLHYIVKEVERRYQNSH